MGVAQTAGANTAAVNKIDTPSMLVEVPEDTSLMKAGALSLYTTPIARYTGNWVTRQMGDLRGGSRLDRRKLVRDKHLHKVD
jgi:hypothetical protein